MKSKTFTFSKEGKSRYNRYNLDSLYKRGWTDTLIKAYLGKLKFIGDPKVDLDDLNKWVIGLPKVRKAEKFIMDNIQIIDSLE